MFINRNHQLNAVRGTYFFPYVIGIVNDSRVWRPTSSTVLTGDLPEKSLSNQLFSTIHRLGFVGAMMKSRQHLVESIEVATMHNVNLDVKIQDVTTSFISDRENARIRKWKEFEQVLSYAFGLEVRD